MALLFFKQNIAFTTEYKEVTGLVDSVAISLNNNSHVFGCNLKSGKNSDTTCLRTLAALYPQPMPGTISPRE